MPREWFLPVLFGTYALIIAGLLWAWWASRHTCVFGHTTPKAWEAPRASYAREKVLGVQDGARYTKDEYRCKRCGKWWSYRHGSVSADYPIRLPPHGAKSSVRPSGRPPVAPLEKH